MQHLQLGQTDLNVSRLCLGTMTWGSQNTEAEAHAQIEQALEAGINFLDTAEIYPSPVTPETVGNTETIIGNWFAKSGQRNKVILATKMAGPGRDYLRNATAPNAQTIPQALEASLKRLQTDCIDLFQLHWPNRPNYHFNSVWNFQPATNATEQVEAMHQILEALGELVQQGKIRHIGLSNESSWGMLTYLHLAQKFSLPRIASIQNEYNLLRRIAETDVAETCLLEKVGFLALSPLAMGILSGKYLNGYRPEGSRMTLKRSGQAPQISEAKLEATAEYAAIAQKYGFTPAQLAMAFVLSRGFVTSMLVGATKPGQLASALDAASLPLPPQAQAEIQSVYQRYPMPF